MEETRLAGTTAMPQTPVTNLGRLAIVMFNQTCNYVYYGSRLAGWLAGWLVGWLAQLASTGDE